MDYQGQCESGMTAEKHDRKACGPDSPLAMYSGIVSKNLRFPLDYRTAGIMLHPSAGSTARRNHTKK